MFSALYAVPAADQVQWIAAITEESDWGNHANLEHAAWSCVLAELMTAFRM